MTTVSILKKKKVPKSCSYYQAHKLHPRNFFKQGYGVIAAAVSTSENVTNIHRCTGFSILISFEAFVGLVFASMWGAIIFIRLSRIQSFAQVSFSEAVVSPECYGSECLLRSRSDVSVVFHVHVGVQVIRYGSGVTPIEDNDHDSEGGSTHSASFAANQIPCPILEFRVVNRMHNVQGGEIIDAALSIVATIDVAQACPTEQGATTRRRLGMTQGKGNRGPVRLIKPRRRERADRLSSNISDDMLNSIGLSEALAGLRADADLQTQELEEDPSGYLFPKKILCRLECESQEHPFFKRVWSLRHTLDEHSPLLRPRARMMVKGNNGFWPEELNNAEGVRAAFSFDQLLVSLSGTANANANSVYAQHMYDIAGTSVGYRFVNMLYRDPDDGSLQVDLSLLNDVMEQAGGGGEDLTSPLGRGRFDDIIVL